MSKYTKQKKDPMNQPIKEEVQWPRKQIHVPKEVPAALVEVIEQTFLTIEPVIIENLADSTMLNLADSTMLKIRSCCK